MAPADLRLCLLTPLACGHPHNGGDGSIQRITKPASYLPSGTSTGVELMDGIRGGARAFGSDRR